VSPASDALCRALGAAFAGFGGRVTVEARARRRWASVTFAGERHEVMMRLEGPDARAAIDGFLDGLADREFDVPGHIVADIAVTAVEDDGETLIRLRLEALTVEAS
jgi:sorbitol-specific phosphotransferase system component IIBC